MKLKENLYNIKSLDREGLSAVVTLRRDSMIYRAHFPEMPVTPGVCIIQTATELLGELTGSDPRLMKVGNAKFLAVISPDETQEVRYSFRKLTDDDATGERKAQVVVSDGDTVFSKLSLVWKI